MDLPNIIIAGATVIGGMGTMFLWVNSKLNNLSVLNVRVNTHEKLLEKISTSLDKNLEALTKLNTRFDDHVENDKFFCRH